MTAGLWRYPSNKQKDENSDAQVAATEKKLRLFNCLPEKEPLQFLMSLSLHGECLHQLEDNLQMPVFLHFLGSMGLNQKAKNKGLCYNQSQWLVNDH